MSVADVLLRWRRIGRDGEIRTRDPLHPMQVRYQAAPRPDRGGGMLNSRASGCNCGTPRACAGSAVRQPIDGPLRIAVEHGHELELIGAAAAALVAGNHVDLEQDRLAAGVLLA